MELKRYCPKTFHDVMSVSKYHFCLRIFVSGCVNLNIAKVQFITLTVWVMLTLLSLSLIHSLPCLVKTVPFSLLHVKMQDNL